MFPLRNLPRKIPPDRRKIPRRLRRRRRPTLRFDIAQRKFGSLRLYHHQPYLVICRCRQVGVRRGRLAHRELHVRLPRRHPHIAHQNVGQRNRLHLRGCPSQRRSSLHRQLKRPARLARLEINAPMAPPIAVRAARFTPEAHHHSFARRCVSPDMHRQIPLHHHVVGKNSWQRHLRGCRLRHSHGHACSKKKGRAMKRSQVHLDPHTKPECPAGTQLHVAAKLAGNRTLSEAAASCQPVLPRDCLRPTAPGGSR